MKQTVPLLACLCALLMVITGVLIVQNTETDHLLTMTQNALANVSEQLHLCEARGQEMQAAQQRLRQQLDDALLSVEEANAAVEIQVKKNEQLLRKMQILEAGIATGGAAYGAAALYTISPSDF